MGRTTADVKGSFRASIRVRLRFRFRARVPVEDIRPRFQELFVARVSRAMGPDRTECHPELLRGNSLLVHDSN